MAVGVIVDAVCHDKPFRQCLSPRGDRYLEKIQAVPIWGGRCPKERRNSNIFMKYVRDLFWLSKIMLT